MNLKGTASINSQRPRRVGLLSVLLFLLAAIGPVPSAWAATTTNDFLVLPVLPDNQVDPDKSFFDLRMEPGQEQVVQLMVSNPGEQELTVLTALNAATTSRNGLINYTSDAAPDDTLETPITEVATVLDSRIVLAPGQSSEVNIAIKMPNTQFDGVLLGGLNVQAEIEPEENGEETVQGVALQNEFLYVIGLKLSQNDTVVEPDLELRGIEPGLLNYRTMVSFHMANTKPVVMKEMQVRADVYAADADEILRSLHLENAEMAPNSTGSFIIDWESNRIDPGEYRLHIVATHQERVWEWDERFAVDSGEANDVNSEALNLEQSNSWMYILLAVVLLLLIALIAYLLGRRSKRDRA